MPHEQFGLVHGFFQCFYLTVRYLYLSVGGLPCGQGIVDLFPGIKQRLTEQQFLFLLLSLGNTEIGE